MSQPTITFFQFVQAPRDFRISSLQFLLTSPTPNSTPPLITPTPLTGVSTGQVPLHIQSGQVNRLILGNAIGAAYGGTGLGSYVTGDLLWASSPNQLSRIPGNTLTSRRFLSQTGDGATPAAPAWNYVNLGEVLRGSVRLQVKNITASYTVLSSDCLIRCNNVSVDPATITLPTATGSGQMVMIKRRSSGLVTVVPGAGDLVYVDSAIGYSTFDIGFMESISLIDSAVNQWDVV